MGTDLVGQNGGQTLLDRMGTDLVGQNGDRPYFSSNQKTAGTDLKLLKFTAPTET